MKTTRVRGGRDLNFNTCPALKPSCLSFQAADFTRSDVGTAARPDAGWRRVMDVNALAVIDGVRLAAQAMRRQRVRAEQALLRSGRLPVRAAEPHASAAGPARATAEQQDDERRRQFQADHHGSGAAPANNVAAAGDLLLPTFDIIAVASAAGIFPMQTGPVYAASKAAVVHLVRSLGPALRASGIRLAAFCPQFIDTGLVSRGTAADPRFGRTVRAAASRLITPQEAADALLALVGNEAAAGRALFMNADSGAELWPPGPGEALRYPLFSAPPFAAAGIPLPQRAPPPPPPAAAAARHAALTAWATEGLRSGGDGCYDSLMVEALSSD